MRINKFPLPLVIHVIFMYCWFVNGRATQYVPVSRRLGARGSGK